MAEGDNTQEQSDFEKVQGYLQEQVSTLFQAEVQRAQQAQQQQQTGMTAEQQQQQALREYLNPVIQPELQAIRVEAADARDFNTVSSDPFYKEYATEVEALFEQTKKTGRPMPRKDLLRYVMGREMVDAPEKFKERLSKREQEQLDRASQAADMGSASISRSPAQMAATAEEFAKLSSDEQAKYLEGITL